MAIAFAIIRKGHHDQLIMICSKTENKTLLLHFCKVLMVDGFLNYQFCSINIQMHLEYNLRDYCTYVIVALVGEVAQYILIVIN